MFLKNCDFLSQKICLNFQGKNRHSSKISGILSIIMIFICTIYIIYLSTDVALHRSRNFTTYTKYVKDVEQVYFNDEENGIFHYFQFITNKNKIQEFDTKYIRIVMTRIYQGYINDFNLLESNEHWIYDKCRDGKDNINFKKGIFNENININGGACLRYYYNLEYKKYYSVGDKNFKYPYLEHGLASSQNLLLNSNIIKCTNGSKLNELLGPCESSEKIENYLNNLRTVYFKLLEKQIDTGNYANPILNYINGVLGTMDVRDVPINNIYFSPGVIKVKKGTFFPKTKRLSTFQYEDNVLSIWRNNGQIDHILAIYNFWILNTCRVIKGGYETLYDILPNLGGMIKLIYYFFFAINYLYDKYVTIQDSARLFLRINEKQYKQDKKKEEYKFNKIVNEMRQENKKYIQNPNLNSNGDDLSQSRKNIINDNINDIVNNKEVSRKFSENSYFSVSALNQNDLIDLNKKKNCSLFNTNNNLSMRNNQNKLFESYKNQTTNYNFITVRRKNESCSNFGVNNIKKFSGNFEQFIGMKKKSIKLEETISDSYLAKYNSFFNYLISFLGRANKKGRLFYILTKFRQKIISEEHFFKTHLFLYYLGKYFNIDETKKIDITKLYSYL